MTFEMIPATKWGRELTGNPSKSRPSQINELTIHYTGAPKVDTHITKVPMYIKSIERMHKARPNEKFSTLGYSFLIDKAGRIWEGRGFGLRNGANGTDSNDTSYSVCLLVGVQDNELSPAVIEAVKTLRAEIERRVGRKVKVTGHRDHKPTSCPGESVYRLIKKGGFYDDASQPAPAPAPAKPVPAVKPDCFATVLSSGAQGECVKTLQTLLAAHGFNPGPVDGDFGSRTRSAVRRFQEAKGLKVDGIVGTAETWPALRRKP